MKLSYWKLNLIILTLLLTIWFIVSFGFGIIWSDQLDNFRISQQGSIYFFILIIFIYVLLMNKLDKRFYSKESDNKSQLKE